MMKERGGALLATVIVLAGCGDTKLGTVGPAWVEIGPDDQAIARVITTTSNCPAIELDGEPHVMDVRAEPEPPDFPVLVCETYLPQNARHAAIDGVSLPLPRPNPQRIAVIGDTGCRLQDGDPPQSCNDPSLWPFAEIAQTVADLKPDLIVHVGDYLYRENACPAGDSGCAGSPYGFNWPSIDADWFTPAAPIFGVAPLLLARGNHELCNLAGNIWFRFLDPRPFTDACADYTEPYAASVGDLQFLMLDSAAANDTSTGPEQVAFYAVQFDQLRALAGPQAMFVTHRPMWGFGSSMGELYTDNDTLQAASDSVLPSGVELVLSGHIHLFQLLSFDPTTAGPRPPQLIVGNSGTSFSPVVTQQLTGQEVAGATVAFGESLNDFGFVTLEADGDGWLAVLRGVTGNTILVCEIVDDQVQCA